MVSPKAAAFLDRIVQFGSGISVGLEEGALVVAVHRADGDYVYNPGSEHLLEAGDSLIVLADTEDMAALRDTVSA
jgi:K+/H+ antiporter YhaU regulatory subunit KhtT